MKHYLIPTLTLAAIGTLALSSNSIGGTISIPDGGQISNLQEDTRALGFARSIGQTFTVPAPTSEAVLSEFTFYVDAGSSPTDVDAAAYVFEFDTGTTSPTGAALFSSPAFAINSDGPLTFTPNVTLNPANTYIAFLSTSGLQDEDNNSANFESNSSNPFAGGGGFRYTGIVTDTSSFTGDPSNWNEVSATWDYRFDASFVPEPSTALLLFLSSGLWLRRRR